jgi:hypothetical protein
LILSIGSIWTATFKAIGALLAGAAKPHAGAWHMAGRIRQGCRRIKFDRNRIRFVTLTAL